MATKTKTGKTEKEIEKITSQLLDKLEVKANIVVTKETDEDKAIHFKVGIQTEETGLLIGHHGETLNSLQLLLGIILYKNLGEWTRVILDVGEYRKMREESTKEMVGRIISEVESTNQPVILPFLTPFERRIVHLMLAENPKITSESQGEGRERRVVIKPRPAD